MKQKRLENSGIASSDLLQRFPMANSIANVGGFNGRVRKTGAQVLMKVA